jgi:hypothetical protein
MVNTAWCTPYNIIEDNHHSHILQQTNIYKSLFQFIEVLVFLYVPGTMEIRKVVKEVHLVT